MAQHVDLMVVGTTDGVSATELTQRLVVEFGQTEEAFTDLVAAACGGSAAYAAQSEVSLDTAIEGQIQLEKLGVVCQVLMDGEVMGTGSPATIADEPAAEEKSAETEISEAPGAEPQPDLPVEAELPEPELKPEPEPEPESDLEADTKSEETADDNDQLPVTNGLEVTDISFGDELEGLGEGKKKSSDTTKKSDSLEEHLPAENGLELNDISFNDELGSLDDEIEKTRDKIKAEKAEKEEAANLAGAAAKTEAQEPDIAETAAEDEPELEESTDELTLDSDDELLAAVKDKTEKETKPADASKAGEELELSLSLDDSAPLTKPKAKSDKVADDGGLTLSLDEDTPLTSPKKESVKPKPEALDTTLSLDEDSVPAPKESPVIEEQVVEAPAEPEVSEVTVEETQIEVETPPAAEARDTSREIKEEVAPLLDEPEPEQPASPEKDDKAPQQNTEQAVPESKKADATTDTESTDPAPVSESAPAGGNALNSLIDDLASNAGGLVLPGQTATDDGAATPEMPPAAEQMGGADLKDSLIQSQLQASGLADNNGDRHDDVAGTNAGAEISVVFEDDEVKLKRTKLIKTAVAASVMVGVLGGGAAFYMSGGLGSNNGVVPVVATVAPVNENSALDAVEEGSLNAAIKRSSDISNPNDYSTEELIVYLADDLGVNAQQELQNYVSGDGQYVVEQQPVPRMGAAIPADSNSVLWLKNRVAHPADKYFDEWSKREVDLNAYMELQERLIEVGDLEIARDVSGTTKDQLFAVMSLQRLARSYNELGHTDKAMELLELAARGTYSIAAEAERTIAIADYALTEKELGLEEDSLDSFLKASILARSLRKPETRTVALSAIAEYYQSVDRAKDMAEYLDLAMTTAYELPVNTAARDLAIRHVALTEVRLGLAAQATDHANLIVDPFAAVSALHGIALELERTGDQTNARLTLNMAYRAGSLIKNSEKREKLLEKIKLAGG